MQPINLPIAELKPALIGLGKVINKHSTLPVLTGVKLERTSEGWITLTATDLERFITVRLDQPVEGEPVSVVIPYADLQKATSQCGSNDTISIRTSENRSVWSVILEYPVGNRTTEQECRSFPVQEFPPTPRVKGEPVQVNDSLRDIIHEAMDCACNDPARQVLNGVFIDVSNPKCNQIVATDGHHLFASNSFSLPLKESVIIPDHKFLGWRGFNSDGEWQLRASEAKDKRLVQIASRRWRFITPQHAGTYPNYRQVIPTEFKATVQLPNESLASAIDAVEGIPCDSKNKDNPVCFKVDNGKFIISGRANNDAPWTDIEIAEAKVSGDPVTIYLNRDFALKAFKFGLNQIEIIDAMSPLRFSRGGKQLVVMPIRIKSATPSAAPSVATETKPQPTIERSNMVSNNTPPEPAEAKPSLETALEQMETLKESLKTNLASVNIITGLLKDSPTRTKGHAARIWRITRHSAKPPKRSYLVTSQLE